ncbi:MAG: tyrosine-type recombinase/integrase [Pseudomonadota bacterium]
MRRYEEAQKERQAPAGPGAEPGTIGAAVDSYYRSPAFLSLARSTQAVYVPIIDALLREMLDGARLPLERQLASAIRPSHIRELMEMKADTPDAANRRLSMLRLIFQRAIEMDLVEANPCREVRRYRHHSQGHHTWTEAEIRRFYDVHRVGSVAHTAMTLMLYTGARRSDAVRLGWPHVESGWIRWRAQKLARRGGQVIELPIHPVLASVLEALPRDRLTFLETKYGQARSAAGLGGLMRKACDAAKLPECTSHGLRKAIARRLAEAGATVHEIMAVGDWQSIKDVEIYTRKAERRVGAEGAIRKIRAVK